LQTCCTRGKRGEETISGRGVKGRGALQHERKKGKRAMYSRSLFPSVFYPSFWGRNALLMDLVVL
jgi:hypothetical protein